MPSRSLKRVESEFQLQPETRADLDRIVDLLATPGLKPAQREQLSKLWDDARWKAASEDPWFFMRHCLRTHDEHNRKNPYQPFPDKDYLRLFVREWQRIDVLPDLSKRILFVWKSRKMMVSWAALALVLWNCLFREGQLVGWQSQKAEDADKMLEKIEGLHRRLIEHGFPADPIDRKFLEIKFPRKNSKVLAVPCGADQVRQFTWSLLVSDEVAFQESAQSAYVAAMPSVEGGGMYVGISSAAPGHFERMVVAQPKPETYRKLCDSFEIWENRSDVAVMKLIYLADPEKTKGWAVEAAKKYPGGMDGADWRAEMEGEFGARSGTLIFPDFSMATHVIKPFEIPEAWPKWRVFDWGYEVPSACAWFTVSPDRQVYLYREHYQSGWEVSRHAQQIIALSGREEYRCSYADDQLFVHQAGQGQKSVSDLFADHKIYFAQAKKLSPKRLMIAALQELMCLGERGPRMRTFDTCPYFIEEALNWRWQQRSVEMREKHDPKEIPVDKADHLCLVAGTLVSTDLGQKPIELVQAGDLVHTRAGLRPVVAAGCTGKDRPIYAVDFEGGSLRGTGNHPVHVEGRGWVPLSGLMPNDILLRWQPRQSTASDSTELSSGSMPVSGTTSQGRPLAAVASSRYTGRPGSRRTGKSHPSCTSTTSTAIRETTTSLTLSRSPPRITSAAATETGRRSALSVIGSTSARSARSLLNGTEARTGGGGTEATRKRSPMLGGPFQALPSPARGAGVVSRRGNPGQPSARATAGPSSASPAGSMTKTASASTAAPPSASTSTSESAGAPSLARVLSPPRLELRRAPAYNLEVEGEHEYFAEGVLVRNCDCALYFAINVDPTQAARLSSAAAMPMGAPRPTQMREYRDRVMKAATRSDVEYE